MAKVEPAKDGAITEIKPNQIGQLFTKKELGITFPNTLQGYMGMYIFFTINNEKYRNELHRDGVVFEPDNEKLLVKGNGTTTKIEDFDLDDRRILVRFHDKGQAAFEFIGIADTMVRYDQLRNKIFIKDGC
jgi:hypothetical protein